MLLDILVFSLFLHFAFYSNLTLSPSNAVLSNVYSILISIIYVEFGFIFISAGIFKFLDSKKNSLSFAMGMMNPMWSKIHTNFKLIHKLRYPLNYIGPINQILGGFLIITGIPRFQYIGFLILFFTFISITPFCKLAWLCPSISFCALYLGSKLELLSTVNLSIFLTCVFLRGLLNLEIYVEYFHNKKIRIPLVYILNKTYRKIMGVIIWKVFTYDVVRYIGPAPGYPQFLMLTSKSINSTTLYEFNNNYSSVYHSIAMCSFLSSRKYLNEDTFNHRLNLYLKILDLEFLPCMNLDQNEFINCSFASNPFQTALFEKLKPQTINNDIRIILDETDFSSYDK